MSDLDQITTALERLFHEEGHRVVVWNDPEGEFQTTLRLLDIEGVTKLELARLGALEVKIRVERQEPETRFLLYSPAEEPDPADDWLLDIRLYGRSFRADRASVILQELGLYDQGLREHIAERRKFFDNKDRRLRLKALCTPDETAPSLDRKMMAVVARADQSELFNLVRTIFHAWTEAGAEIELDEPPACWDQIEKFDLGGPYWSMVKATFGYEDENPSLKNFLLRLLLTDYAHHLKAEVPQALRSLLLPSTGWPNAVVCLAQWRDSSSKGASYDRLSADAAAILNIEAHLAGLEIEQLADVMTFLAVEKRVASCLRERVQSTAVTIDAAGIRAIAGRRQAGHWASTAMADTTGAPREALHAVYDALVSAAEFFDLRNQHRGGFHFPDAPAMYRAYESELFRFDGLYRRFCEAADFAESKGWGILKHLRPAVEDGYVNGYLADLALAWGRFIEPPGGLLQAWQIDRIPNQYRFYEDQVRPWLQEAEKRRAFVIISDAFRYEAAHELGDLLNGKYRFEATLTSQLGVLPSYTPLGMASLLPHETLAYKDEAVLVDGKSSAAGDRDAILKVVGGMACKADDLLAMKKDEGREFIRESRVVYIYHNKVDSTGDDAKTEGETFQAVREAIESLAALVGYVVNNLNGHYVVVTADHGFLFAETPPGEADKSKLDDHPEGTVLAKKRYLIGRDLPDAPAAWHGRTAVTAKALGEMEFWIPKGTNRFHFAGGARFIHGGAMPQEVVVPVLTVRHIRGKSAADTRSRPVSVQVLGSAHRITMAKHRFQLIQMEPVEERIRPITLKVCVYEGDEPVTNVESVTFESTSGNMDERKRWVQLVLKDRAYNKKTPYRLVLRDAETGIEQQSVEVTIDRAFTDDF